MNTERVLFLGIDGGGSKCRATLQDASGNLLGEGLSGAANLLRGIPEAQSAVMDAYHQAREQAGLTESDDGYVVAGLGLAGANLEHLKRDFLSTWQHPFAEVYLTTDLEIACLGAHRGGAGGVVIIGTGSCGLVSLPNETLMLGGHGFILGDKGSGAWFGLQLLQHCLEACCGLKSSSAEVAAVLEFTGCEDEQALVTRFATASPKEFAALAPLVFSLAESGDCYAQEIVSRGVAYIEALCQKLMSKSPPRFSLIGGLSPLIAQRLSPTLKNTLSPALHQPEIGAIIFARQNALGSGTNMINASPEAFSVT